MAGVRGNRDSLSDTTVQRRFVSDQSANISPKTIPFLKHIGIDGNASDNTKREWQEDALYALTATVSTTTPVANNSVTTLVLSANDAFNFRVGDIIIAESEYLRVTAVAADNSLTVSRGYASTTAAAHAAGVTVTRIGQSQLENVDTSVAGTSIHSFPFNYHQIWDIGYQISHRAQQQGEYNVDDRLDYEAAKFFTAAQIELERAIFYGKRVLQTSAIPSAFGGLEVYITDNTDTTSEALTEKKINDLQDLIFQDVGHENMADLIVVQSWQKRKISDIYRPLARMERSERTGGVVVDTIDTDFGSVDVMMVYNCPTDSLYLLNSDFISVHPFKNSAWFTEPLPEDGPYFKEHLYGDYTLQVKADKAHGYMSNLTTS